MKRAKKRWTIKVWDRGPVDELGRCSFTLLWEGPDGIVKAQCYRANVRDTVKQLRHNIAAQFWFDRYQRRMEGVRDET